jgi:hypothetical protein
MGNYTNAYATAKPLEGSVVDLVTNFENQDNIRRKEDLIRDSNKAQLKDKQQELKQRRLDRIKYPKAELTKLQTYDDYQTSAITAASDGIYDAMMEISKEETTKERENELWGKIRALNRTPEMLKSAGVALKKMNDDYNTGKFHQNTTFDTFRLNGASGWIPAFDEKGNLMTAFMDKDVNEDGVIDKLDLVTHEDLAQHTPMFQFDKIYDRTSTLKADLATLKPESNTTDNGTTSHLKSGLPAPTAQSVAQSRIFKLDGSLTPEGKSFALQAGLPLTVKDKDGNEVENTKGLKELADDYAVRIESGIPKVDAVNKNNQMDIHNQNRRDKKTAAQAKAAEDYTDFAGVSVTEVTGKDNYGFSHQKGDRRIAVVNGSFKNATGSAAALNSVSMNKDGSWSYYVETKNLGEEPTMTDEAKIRFDNGDATAGKKLSDFKNTPSVHNEYRTGVGSGSAEAQKVIVQLINPDTGQRYKSLQEVQDRVRRKIEGKAGILD